ncbi:hypothetical protein [Rhodoplanes sp. Z2-YC6860]|uniref:hypothetical protein n=1 Tax=Rhodoplanes sp. Z2-YC6860 TaxID=674703 RepID=UPI0012EEDDF9|nr:hypothetical protein [Rhodoplanes sp. Z2-YC6860]
MEFEAAIVREAPSIAGQYTIKRTQPYPELGRHFFGGPILSNYSLKHLLAIETAIF